MCQKVLFRKKIQQNLELQAELAKGFSSAYLYVLYKPPKIKICRACHVHYNAFLSVNNMPSLITSPCASDHGRRQGGSFGSSDPPFKIRQALSYSRFLWLLQAQAYASAKSQDCNSCVQPHRGVIERTRNHFSQNKLRLDRVRCYTDSCGWLCVHSGVFMCNCCCFMRTKLKLGVITVY